MHQISKICLKTLHGSGMFFAHHQELSTVLSAVGTFHAGYVTAWNLTLLGSGHISCMKCTNCRVYSR
jgi:hypothetical protein